jgi:hypothetical protein
MESLSMVIDDPLDALQRQFDDEERSTDPVLKRLLDLLSSLPLPWAADKTVRRLLGRLSADRVERIELTLIVVRDELKRHEDKLKTMSEGPRFDEWSALFLDGLKRAEQTRAKERVERIGRILANALVRTPAPREDDVEEMMRVAMNLSDREVQMLNELVRMQGSLVNNTGHVDRYQAWNSWPGGPWGEKVDGELDIVFSKLESFGLVTRLAQPNNLNIMADFQNRYALLGKGLDFIKFVHR